MYTGNVTISRKKYNFCAILPFFLLYRKFLEISYTTKAVKKSFTAQTVDKVALEYMLRSHFSFIYRILLRTNFFLGFPASSNLFFALIFANFLRFMHAKVNPTFISIRAFPYICVYRKPWFSFAVPNIRSIVSFCCAYKSFIPDGCRMSSHMSMYGSHICLVTVLTWSLLSVHCEKYGHAAQVLPQFLYSLYPSLFVVRYVRILFPGQI